MQPPSPKLIKESFADPQSFGTTLFLALYAAYGSEPLGSPDDSDGWSPETVHMEIKDDFRVNLGPGQFGKLMAALMTVKDPTRFVTRATDFIDLANAFNGDSYNPAMVDPVTSLEAAWAIYEVTILDRLFFEDDPDVSDLIPDFSEEIRGYLEHTLQDEGIINPPDILRIASYNPDRMGQVLSDWTDDPDMTGAIHEAMDDRTTTITSELKARMELLFNQVAKLFATDTASLLDKLKISGV